MPHLQKYKSINNSVAMYERYVAMQLCMHKYIHVCISGSQLTKCTFNGQQCCSEQTLNFFRGFVGPAIEGARGAFDFDSALMVPVLLSINSGVKLEVHAYGYHNINLMNIRTWEYVHNIFIYHSCL